MQTASTGDNLHEMCKSVFWEKQEKYQFDICPESGKGQMLIICKN